jgi:sporulation-control protein spo0M
MKTCKDISELLSDSMDRTLTAREHWAVRLHLLLCRHCSRFQTQLHFLHKAAERYSPTEHDKIPPAK